MKILLFGKNGQVGWELQRSLAPYGELIALGRNGAPGLCGDLTDLEALRSTIHRVKPDVIVNAAAYTNVDNAEDEPALADVINAIAPAVMAKEAAALGCWLVHYSTDYVFDGSGATPWCETDVINPINQYALSKGKGERAILASGCRHLILRASWVYGTHGHNFIKTMLRLMRDREELNVVSDQIGTPTGADVLADVTTYILHQVMHHPERGGLYHLASGGETNWHDYAVYIATHARQCGLSLKVKNINPILTSEYVTRARRPLNSRLDTSKLRQTFSLKLPDWRQGVSRVIYEIIVDRQ